MTAKALRNPALRTKFNVGDTVKLPTDVWQKFTSKLAVRSQVHGVVAEVGDRIIEHGKNRLCRFAVVLDSPQIGKTVVWEEWMLDRMIVMFYAEKPKEPTKICDSFGQEIPGQ